MGRILVVVAVGLVACSDAAANTTNDATAIDAVQGIDATGLCSDAFDEAPIDAEGFACVSGRVLGVYFEHPDPSAECFDICEDAWEFGFGLVEEEVVAGAVFDLSKPGVGFYAEVSGSPSEPAPACFCATLDSRPSRGEVRIIDYDGSVVCGTVSDFLPRATGSFVVPISPECE